MQRHRMKRAGIVLTVGAAVGMGIYFTAVGLDKANEAAGVLVRSSASSALPWRSTGSPPDGRPERRRLPVSSPTAKPVSKPGLGGQVMP